MRVRLEFKREDCWIGVFWRTRTLDGTTTGLFRARDNMPFLDVERQRDIWICALPMLPLHLTHTWTERVAADDPVTAQ